MVSRAEGKTLLYFECEISSSHKGFLLLPGQEDRKSSTEDDDAWMDTST